MQFTLPSWRKTMKRTGLTIVLSLLILLLATTVAVAGYGVHDIYEEDGDSCTGCHRDHSIESLSASTMAAKPRHSIIPNASAIFLLL